MVILHQVKAKYLFDDIRLMVMEKADVLCCVF